MTEHGKLTWRGLHFPKYESPIDVEIIPPMDDMFTQAIIEQTENGIMAKVRYALQVNVNKEELIKALDYDRNQYEKGYKDALEDIGIAHPEPTTYDHGREISRDMIGDVIVGIQYSDWHCVKCGYKVDGKPMFKYCPNCGRVIKETTHG